VSPVLQLLPFRRLAGVAIVDSLELKGNYSPYPPDRAAVRSGTGAARASRMTANAVRLAFRRPDGTQPPLKRSLVSRPPGEQR
jgi:hypothetical protein